MRREENVFIDRNGPCRKKGRDLYLRIGNFDSIMNKVRWKGKRGPNETMGTRII